MEGGGYSLPKQQHIFHSLYAKELTLLYYSITRMQVNLLKIDICPNILPVHLNRSKFSSISLSSTSSLGFLPNNINQHIIPSCATAHLKISTYFIWSIDYIPYYIPPGEIYNWSTYIQNMTSKENYKPLHCYYSLISREQTL